MQVKLISLTQSMVTNDQGVYMDMTAEELIVYTARVSNPDNQMNMETSEKLLAFLIKNKHWSPLDMVDMTVEVKTSRAIAQQILRHWSHRFQEFSQRYAEAVMIEPVEIRKSGSTNRQSSTEVFNPTVCGGISAHMAIEAHLKSSVHLYKELIKAGAAKECARFVLPLATQTTLYMKASARSWVHYLEQRLDAHAQLEHRNVAALIFDIFATYFPNLAKTITYER